MPSINNLANTLLVRKSVLFLAALALLSLPVNAQLFKGQNLVSDIPNVGTQPTDPNLVNSWGIAASGGSPWWVADNGTGNLTIYDGTGLKQGLTVSVSQWDGTPGGNPTGQVFNGTTDFKLSNGSP